MLSMVFQLLAKKVRCAALYERAAAQWLNKTSFVLTKRPHQVRARADVVVLAAANIGHGVLHFKPVSGAG